MKRIGADTDKAESIEQEMKRLRTQAAEKSKVIEALKKKLEKADKSDKAKAGQG